LVELVKWIELA